MVDFLWGDNYRDSGDAKEDLKTEFENYLSDSNDESFYRKTAVVKYSMDDDDAEEERFDAFIQEVMDEVLDQELEEWLKKSPGWTRFKLRRSTSQKVKTGTDKDGKDVFSTKDKQMENETNLTYIRDKTLGDVLKPEVVRRLKGLNYLRRQEENLQKELSDDNIEELLENPRYLYEIDLTESTNREGVPTGKVSTGTGNLQSKVLNNKAHMIVEFPNVLGDDKNFEDEIESMAKKRAKELSDLTGNLVTPTKKSESIELAEIVLDKYDFSLSEDFIEKINADYSKRTLSKTEYEIGALGDLARQKVSKKEWLRLLKNEYAKYVRKYNKLEEESKKTGRKVSNLDLDIPVEEEVSETDKDDKGNPLVTERKLTLTEYREQQGITPVTISFPVTPFIMQVFTTITEGNEAELSYDYDQKGNRGWFKLPKDKDPITFTMSGGDHTPISMEYRDDAQIEKLIDAIVKELLPEALASTMLRDFNRVSGIRAQVTLKVKEGKKKAIHTVVREGIEAELEGEPTEGYEISEGWKNKETDEIINDSKYRRLLDKDKQNYEESFRQVEVDDVRRIKDAEKNKDIKVQDMAGQDVTGDYNTITYRTGVVPLDKLNESFKEVNVVVKAYTSQVYEIPSAQLRPAKNKELAKTIDGYKKQIRRMDRLLSTNEDVS